MLPVPFNVFFAAVLEIVLMRLSEADIILEDIVQLDEQIVRGT